MATTSVFTVVRPGAALLLAVLCMATTMPGGFQLRAELPAGTAYQDAALVVRTYRCHQPDKANVSGTAEGSVRGERRSQPLTLKTVGKGVYTVTPQWPAEGAWVLAITGTYRGQTSSLLVELDPEGKVALTTADDGGKVEPNVRTLHRKLSARDIESALQRTTEDRRPTID